MKNAPAAWLRLREWTGRSLNREDRVAVLLSFVIGALVGLVVVAFILLTGRLAARMYPPGSAVWRRIFVPTAGALVSALWFLSKASGWINCFGGIRLLCGCGKEF